MDYFKNENKVDENVFLETLESILKVAIGAAVAALLAVLLIGSVLFYIYRKKQSRNRARNEPKTMDALLEE